jgi:hypothetical protein
MKPGLMLNGFLIFLEGYEIKQAANQEDFRKRLKNSKFQRNKDQKKDRPETVYK